MSIVLRPKMLPRRLLAGSVAAALALGGSLLIATPATAAPGDDLVVLTPGPTSTQTTSTFIATGTASDGARISVVDEQPFLVGSAIAAPDGTFTVAVNLVDTVTSPQTLTFTQVEVSGDPAPEVSEVTIVVELDLPAPVPARPLVVTGPIDGSTSASRSVTFIGSAPVGSDVRIFVGDEDVIVPLAADGSFEFPLYLGVVVPDRVTVTVGGTDVNGVTLVPTSLTLNLQPVIAAPVVVRPIDGSEVVGSTVTVSGTGVAGAQLSYVLVRSGAQSASEELGPVVDSRGNWSFTAPVAPGEYGLTVLHSDVDGLPLSPQSNFVEFTVLAAAAPAAVLAATGPTSAGLAAPAGALLMLGLAMVAVGRRRRALV